MKYISYYEIYIRSVTMKYIFELLFITKPKGDHGSTRTNVHMWVLVCVCLCVYSSQFNKVCLQNTRINALYSYMKQKDNPLDRYFRREEVNVLNLISIRYVKDILQRGKWKRKKEKGKRQKHRSPIQQIPAKDNSQNYELELNLTTEGIQYQVNKILF